MAPMLTDVAAGNLAFAVSTLPPALPLIAAGRLRALAVTTGTTSPALAGVPTVTQAGIKEVDLNTWYGLWAKEGAPPAAVARLNALLTDYLKDPETARLLLNNGIVVAQPVTSKQTEQRLKADMAVWRSVVHRSGLKLE
jgi:tripartite-type tricarboxylate transporter receptor subunit TctC